MAGDEPRSAAVERLTTLGLSTYAARTFVALSVLVDGQGDHSPNRSTRRPSGGRARRTAS